MGGLYFDGGDDRVSAGPSALLNMTTNDFSIDAWIKTPQSGAFEAPIVDRRIEAASGDIRGYRMYLRYGRLAASIADPQFPGETDFISSTPVIADDCWHHVAVTIKRYAPNARVKLYVDGAPIAQFIDRKSVV